ncbi:hypothetical protein V6N13_099427 [Hibiscus sabdariffa]
MLFMVDLPFAKIWLLREILDDSAKQWENALLANFLGKSPPLAMFQKVTDNLWGREGGDSLIVNVDQGQVSMVVVADVIGSAAAGFDHVEIVGSVKAVGRAVDIAIGVSDELVLVASGVDAGEDVGGDIVVDDAHLCVSAGDSMGIVEMVQSNMDKIEVASSQSHGLVSGIEVSLHGFCVLTDNWSFEILQGRLGQLLMGFIRS